MISLLFLIIFFDKFSSSFYIICNIDRQVIFAFVLLFKRYIWNILDEKMETFPDVEGIIELPSGDATVLSFRKL